MTTDIVSRGQPKRLVMASQGRALADSSSNGLQRCRSSIRIGKITLKPPIYATVAVARAFKLGLLMLCLPNLVFVTVSRCSRPITTFLGLLLVSRFGCGHDAPDHGLSPHLFCVFCAFSRLFVLISPNYFRGIERKMAVAAGVPKRSVVYLTMVSLINGCCLAFDDRAHNAVARPAVRNCGRRIYCEGSVRLPSGPPAWVSLAHGSSYPAANL
jgi:hypothetical protein